MDFVDFVGKIIVFAIIYVERALAKLGYLKWKFAELFLAGFFMG